MIIRDVKTTKYIYMPVLPAKHYGYRLLDNKTRHILDKGIAHSIFAALDELYNYKA